ncbi:MAG: histidinol-phosphate transaminase [Ruminiclostridium sp.]|nr:histidinol-phosphate transaminase [Ruminiclostridium sp.]
MNKYWSELANRLDPYVPGEQPKDRKYIKLNTNENPYGPSPRVLEAIRNCTDESLKLYPDPTCDTLLTAAAEYYGVRKDQVFAGNGSDEILAFSYMAFFDPGKAILFPDITYTFYPVYAQLFNIEYKLINVAEDFEIPEKELYQSPGGVIIANPNAPTGKYMPLASVKRILDNNAASVVIIDEAYIDFGGESAVKLIEEYPNLLVIHTFSKSRSLAGMRLGFALGDSNLIKAINSVKNSFNSYTIDRLAIAAGIEAFRDVEYFEAARKKVMGTRERVSAEMAAMGFNVIDSKANFIFTSHPFVKAAAIFALLREKGILVRYFNKPRIDNYLRITMGSNTEMDVFLATVKDIVQAY